ncbi:MAG: hypothetical protein KatS3mg077_0229 [Candidatus Binatia bacterium]|nr:MAG: hypothetical protein KatS3mg077_0229 [Candidatus Binatia bacterium]
MCGGAAYRRREQAGRPSSFAQQRGSARLEQRGPIVGLAFTLALCVGSVAAGATFTVNSVLDLPDAAPGDRVCSAGTPDVCTLRAAVQEANATSEEDVIRVPSLQPRFRLTLHGSDGEDATRGDLDILGNIVLEGIGPGVALIDGDRADRIFDVFDSAQVTIRNLVLQQGQVEAAGGAIRNGGILKLEAVTFRDNAVSAGSGGALANLPGARAELLNCTFFNNTAMPNGQGGAIANLPGATLVLESVTLSTNGATAGGAIHNLGVATIHNSVVAASSTGGNCGGVPLVSRGFNLDTGGSCLFDQPGDLNNADPRLSGLAFNGGLSLTMALLPGSDAIDRGDPTDCPLQDQRGFPRPADGDSDAFAVCDIGAFEVNPPTPTPTITATATPTVPTPTATITPTPSPVPPSPTASQAEETQTPTPTRTPSVAASPTLASPSATPSPSVTPAFPVLEVTNVNAIPGSRVRVSVRLRAANYQVGAVQVEMAFDPAYAPIAPADTGLPDCSPNTALGKSFLVEFRPVACIGEQCTRTVAFLFSELPPVTEIPDESVLWSCTVAVSSQAPLGAYALTLRDAFVADVDGERIPNVMLSHGAVVVMAPTDTPTSTASPTPTATPSPTQGALCPGDCNGDQRVTIEELVTMAGIALELRPVAACEAADRDRNGQVTVDEIVAAVARALNGCEAHDFVA